MKNTPWAKFIGLISGLLKREKKKKKRNRHLNPELWHVLKEESVRNY